MSLKNKDSNPSFIFENQFPGQVAGVDEAGCGPWAGPVVAAAAIINQSLFPALLSAEINDSKKLTKKKRSFLYQELIQHPCVTYSIGISSVEEIDQFNIWGATQLAMQRAVEELPLKPDTLLIDGKRKPNWDYSMHLIIKGDQKSFSIAAASIIAKVKRDEMMDDLHQQYPHFGWNRNAGYGTSEHQRALAQYGVTSHHRKSFAPIRSLLT